MRTKITLAALLVIGGGLRPGQTQTNDPGSGWSGILMDLAKQTTVPLSFTGELAVSGGADISEASVYLASKASPKKTSRARRWTFWTVTTLGAAYGTFGLLASLKAASKHAEYMDAVISYDAQRLGDDMQQLQEKAYSQLTLSTFFLIISTMMAMDLQYGGG